MKKDEIKEYILSQTEFQAPAVQNMFSASYPEMKEVLDELTKDRKIEFVSGLTYKVSRSDTVIYQPKDDREALYIRALWECIERGSVNTVTLQRRLNIGYSVAARAIDWMEDNGYVSPLPAREVLIPREGFIETFGMPVEQSDSTDDGALSHIFDSEEDEDDDDIMDILALLEGDGEKDASDEEDAEIDFKSALIEAFSSGLKNSDTDSFTIGFSDGMRFELKFIRDGNALRISDGGRTLFGSALTRRKVTNVLKDFAPAALDENMEIYATVELPSDTLMSLLILYAAVSAVKRIK